MIKIRGRFNKKQADRLRTILEKSESNECKDYLPLAKHSSYIIAQYNFYKIDYYEGITSLMQKSSLRVHCGKSQPIASNITLLNPWFYNKITEADLDHDLEDEIAGAGKMFDFKVINDDGFYLSNTKMTKSEAQAFCENIESQ